MRADYPKRRVMRNEHVLHAASVLSGWDHARWQRAVRINRAGGNTVEIGATICRAEGWVQEYRISNVEQGISNVEGRKRLYGPTEWRDENLALTGRFERDRSLRFLVTSSHGVGGNHLPHHNRLRVRVLAGMGRKAG